MAQAKKKVVYSQSLYVPKIEMDEVEKDYEKWKKKKPNLTKPIHRAAIMRTGIKHLKEGDFHV